MASNAEAPESGRPRTLTEKGRAYQFGLTLTEFKRIYKQLDRLFKEVDNHLKQTHKNDTSLEKNKNSL